MSSYICRICGNLSFAVKSPNETIRMVLEDLLAETGTKDTPCRTCRFLWQAISEITEGDTVHPEITYTSFDISPAEHGDRIGKGPLHGHLVPNPALGAKAATPVDLQFYTLPTDPPSPWTTIGRGYHITPNGLSDSCVSLLRSWLALCTTSQGKHTRCSTPPTPSLPTRLVHVGTATEHPRLYLTKPHEKSRFAALSHCWGGASPVRTLNRNIEDHFMALPLSSLPQTFADAIAVTRAMGLEFLWIDSLCIIQDDLQDWEREAARMAHVYANAWVTISADAATDADKGFLGPPSRMVPAYKSIPVTAPDGGDGHALERTVHVRKRGFLAEELPFHYWSVPTAGLRSGQVSGRSKLATRGWVFQERILSPRTVHFSQHEMAWECRSVCDCECSATSARTLRTTSVVKHFLDHSGDGGTTDSIVPKRATWRRDIVPAYTRLELTVPTDRLAALASLKL
ncbi:heterokaryon incompatibility protein-domain-containing protein [Cercophora newfieldiana]|uniref:Heterokaryon incompatibility protein-domain-containing protein n=1 Tax=Cercophora newfieldiana TaxID=92897 RepID=A0AA40CNG4_9PEZI|nr:heterokaryon incompatibility protein-domain-containing protein [Cercophora newfieldiana]